ncbi:YchJ family protein [Flavobacterium sp. NKUCC04_CG]|uniref:YchJ family protein n=1 Tax=Flavobacterium sp. NKUCC04_CG TaxID=2842121 RepID=UPI002105AB12|nr:YchJ family metal-binding protein [Flavobacterium sp. NKUCC04_CG]
MMMEVVELACYCGHKMGFEACCKPFIIGKQNPSSPEQLMRSRYTAYVLIDADYILKTTHPKTRYLHKKRDILAWAKESDWAGLDVLEAHDNLVVFKAYYRDRNQQLITHAENAVFEQVAGKWFYLTAK